MKYVEKFQNGNLYGKFTLPHNAGKSKGKPVKPLRPVLPSVTSSPSPVSPSVCSDALPVLQSV